jgi:hypothetical protein
MDEYLKAVAGYGWVPVVILWLLNQAFPKVFPLLKAKLKRDWAQENRKVAKIEELYERMLTQQETMVRVIAANTTALDNNATAMGQVREAIEHEFPLLLSAVRTLTMRVGRLEQTVGIWTTEGEDDRATGQLLGGAA